MSKPAILIVEDSFIVALHLQKTLEGHGYEVSGIVDSGEAALNAIQKVRPSIVMMDIMLNGRLDGIETAQLIKSRFNLPVIYITALSDGQTIQRAKITEPYGYLTKPFEDRQVFTVLEMAIYKHSMEARLKQSEERFFSTVKSISDCVMSIDKEFNVVYLNPSAEKITGWNLTEAQGRPVFEVLTVRDEALETAVNPFQCSMTREKESRLIPDLLLIGRHGSSRPIGEGSISPIMNDAGIAIGLVLVFKDLTEKVSHTRQIKELERKNLAALLEGQESERSRIAKDIHDSLGQTLNAIKMNIDLRLSEEKRNSILKQLINDAIQESIRISENLLPAKLKDFDLATCIRSFCEEISIMTGKPVHFSELGHEDVDVDQLQKINIYRIVQEAVNNAVKHAEASSINVQLNIDQGQIQLIIEDDGNGFAKNAAYDVSKHHGLVNMRDRAEIMNGTFTLESDSTRGTLIIVEAPLKQTDNSKYAKA